MKYFLLTTVLCTPVTALAQESAKAPSSQTSSPQVVDVESALQRSVNPRGFTLATDAVLYRQLRDTLNNHFVRRLRPGDNVIIRQQLPHWFKVVRGNANATGFSKDTKSYYLPASAAKGAWTFILI